jgi:hypothetical protein
MSNVLTIELAAAVADTASKLAAAGQKGFSSDQFHQVIGDTLAKLSWVKVPAAPAPLLVSDPVTAPSPVSEGGWGIPAPQEQSNGDDVLARMRKARDVMKRKPLNESWCDDSSQESCGVEPLITVPGMAFSQDHIGQSFATINKTLDLLALVLEQKRNHH